MAEILFWLYLINSVLLINHEIDSAYWKEWELFKISGGISAFLIIHFPMLFIILFGLIEVYKHTLAGLIISLLLSLAGITAFVIHTYFLKKGRPEFNQPVSKLILGSSLLVSLVQLSVTVYLLFIN